MNRTRNSLLALATLVFGADAAFAQATGGAAPLPGAADAKAVVSQTRETNADFNRQVGSKDRKPGRHKPAVVAATGADLVAGSAVRDQQGAELGTIESVDAEGVVIASPVGKVKVPADSFGKGKAGLLLAISKADFDAAVKQANAPQG